MTLQFLAKTEIMVMTLTVVSPLKPNAISTDKYLEACFININVPGLIIKSGVLYYINRYNTQNLYNVISDQT